MFVTNTFASGALCNSIKTVKAVHGLSPRLNKLLLQCLLIEIMSS